MNIYKNGGRSRRGLVYAALVIAISDNNTDADITSQICENLFDKYIKKRTILDLCDYELLVTDYCGCTIRPNNARKQVYSLLSSRFQIKDVLSKTIFEVAEPKKQSDPENHEFMDICNVLDTHFWRLLLDNVMKLNRNTKGPIKYVDSIHIVLSYVLFGNEYHTEFLELCEKNDIINFLRTKGIVIAVHDPNDDVEFDDNTHVHIVESKKKFGYYTTPHDRHNFTTQGEIEEHIGRSMESAQEEVDSGNVSIENKYVRDYDVIGCLLYTYDDEYTAITGMRDYITNKDMELGVYNTSLFVMGYVRGVDTACKIHDRDGREMNFEICIDNYVYYFVVRDNKKTTIHYTAWSNKEVDDNTVLEVAGVKVADIKRIEVHTKKNREKEVTIIKLAAIFCRYVKRECHKEKKYSFDKFYSNFNLKSDEVYEEENIVGPILNLFNLPYKKEKKAREEYNENRDSHSGLIYTGSISRLFDVKYSELSILCGPNQGFLKKFPSTFNIRCLKDPWQLEYSSIIQPLERDVMWLSYDDILLRSFMFIDLIKDDVTVVNSDEMSLRVGDEWVNDLLICIVEITGLHWGVLMGKKSDGVLYQYDDMEWYDRPAWRKAKSRFNGDIEVTTLTGAKGDGTNCGITVALAIKLFCIYFQDDRNESDEFVKFFENKFKVESQVTYAKRLNMFLRRILKYKDGMIEAYGDIEVDNECITFREDERKKLDVKPSSKKSVTKNLDQSIKDLGLPETTEEMEIEFPNGFDEIYAQYVRDGNDKNFKESYNTLYATRQSFISRLNELKKFQQIDDVVIRLQADDIINERHLGNLSGRKQELQEMFDEWKDGDVETGSQFIQRVCEKLLEPE